MPVAKRSAPKRVPRASAATTLAAQDQRPAAQAENERAGALDQGAISQAQGPDGQGAQASPDLSGAHQPGSVSDVAGDRRDNDRLNPYVAVGNEGSEHPIGRMANYLKVEARDLVRWDNFARLILKSQLYECQAAVLRDIEKDDTVPGYGKVACSACNEAGKTQNIISPAVLAQMLLSPGSRVVVTAKQERQIKLSLMDSLRIFKPVLGNMADFGAMEVKINFPGEVYSQMIGFTTNEDARFQSFHRRPGSELFIILDEAAEIDSQIWFAADRCRPNRMLACSAPGLFPAGDFHKIMTTNERDFIRHVISAYMCPHIPAKRIEEAKRVYGEDSAKFRSMILGQVTEESDDAIFSASCVDRCMLTPPEFYEGALRKTSFIDWSTGGDEIVVALVNGNRASIPLAFTTDRNAIDAAQKITRRVYETLREYHMAPDPRFPEVGEKPNNWGDDDGVGWHFNKDLRNEPFNVNLGLFRGGQNPLKYDYYNNLITECWYDVAELVRKHKIILPNDPTLRHQLISRKKKYSDRDPTKAGMESKEDMRSRGLKSPDRADAVICAIAMAGGFRDRPRPIDPKSVDLFSEKMNLLNFDIDNSKEIETRLNRIGANAGLY